MASYNELLALIDAYINRNGVQAITGQILNGVLKAMVDQLGRGYTLMGYAEPTGDPGTPDGPESWFASVPGTYTNYGEIQVAAGELALLSFAPSEGWTKNTIYEGFREVTATADDNIGFPQVGVTYANGVLSFDFKNIKGEPGENGDPAGFGSVTASVDDQVGTPSVSVSSSGPDTAKNFAFAFHNLKGETGVTSVVATVDNTSGNPQCSVSLQGGQLTLAFTGLKGAQGNTGSSVDYPFTIVNNLTTNDPAQALSAAMGVELDGKVSQLEAEVTEIKQHFSEKTVTKTDITTTDYDGVQTGKYLASNGAIYSSQYYDVYRKHFTDETKINYAFLEANLGMAVSDTENGTRTVVAYYGDAPGEYTIQAGKWLHWCVKTSTPEKTKIETEITTYGDLENYASEAQVLAVDERVDETNERIDDAGLESNTKTLTNADFCDLVVSSGTFVQTNATYNSFYLPMRKGALYKITGSVSNIYTTDTKPELNAVANVLTLRTNTELIAGDDDKYLFLTVAVASYGSVTVKEEYGVALQQDILLGNAFTQYTTREDFNNYIKWVYIENGPSDMMINILRLENGLVNMRVVKSTDNSVYYAYAVNQPYKPGVPTVINGFGGNNIRIYIIFNEGTFNNQGYAAFFTDVSFSLKTNGLGISEKNFQEVFKPLNGQSILFLGDSVLEFTDTAGNTYPDYVSGVTGATIYNGAIGGTRISKRPTTGGDPRYRPFDISSLVDAITTGDWTEQEAAAEDLKSSYPQYETIIARMKAIDYTKLDAIVINGGSNDWSSSVPFGDNDSEDTATFRGAINYIVKILLTAYTQLRVYFVTNSVRYWVSITPAQWGTIYQNTQGKTLEDYTNETIVMANRNNIPSYDWFHDCGINPYNFAKYFGTNSAHINEYARHYFASKIGAYLVRDYRPE